MVRQVLKVLKDLRVRMACLARQELKALKDLPVPLERQALKVFKD
jgi:hypothetical protein